MVVAIDTLFMLEKFRYTGTAIYLHHLLSECLKIGAAESSGVEFHGFRTPLEDWANNGLNSPLLRVHEARSLGAQPLWLLGGMAFHTSRIGADLVFLPTAHHSLPWGSVPTVTAILDAIPRLIPSTLGPKSTPLHAMTWINAKLAQRIITISAWSKKDLVEIYGIKPEKISVTYLGCNSKVFNRLPPDREGSDALLARLGIRRPYVLYHGMLQIRKNVQGLIRAWDRVRSSCKDLDLPLVLAGPSGYGYGEIARTREASPYRDAIIFAGALPYGELGLLVKNAALCVVPSLYEGFCLPMVEAMACGVPTVASNSSCLPEVSGRVLEYFDPHSVEEMAATIQRGLEDSSLRERLHTKGLARAAEFSWQRCARETLQIFEQTVASHSRQSS